MQFATDLAGTLSLSKMSLGNWNFNFNILYEGKNYFPFGFGVMILDSLKYYSLDPPGSTTRWFTNKKNRKPEVSLYVSCSEQFVSGYLRSKEIMGLGVYIFYCTSTVMD